MNDPLISYEYSPLVDRKPFSWPNQSKIAVVITVNLEAWDIVPDPTKPYEGPSIVQVPIPPGQPNYANYTWREYGHRVGVFRLINVLAKYKVFSSCSLNAAVGEKFPVTIREGKKNNWEFLAHSYRQNELLTYYANDPEAETELINRTLRKFEEVVGTRAKGWLSPSLSPTRNTLKILAKAGIEFFCDYANDDQPYILNVQEDGGDEIRRVVSIPYSLSLNDYSLFVKDGYTSAEFSQAIIDAFDVMCEEQDGGGRILNIGLHPHISGQPHLIKGIDNALKYICSERGGVWFPRREQIADWFLSQV